MATDESSATRVGARSAPDIVAPTNRINVALPFSRLEVSESSKDLAELASIVTDLIAVLEASNPSAEVEKLAERAQVLSARLR